MNFIASFNTLYQRFNVAQMEACALELGVYRGMCMADVEDFNPMVDLVNHHEYEMAASLRFWRSYTVRQRIPSLSKVAQHCMLYVPSSAAAERVFSILKANFELAQMHAGLQDYTMLATILRCNENSEKHPF